MIRKQSRAVGTGPAEEKTPGDGLSAAILADCAWCGAEGIYQAATGVTYHRWNGGDTWAPCAFGPKSGGLLRVAGDPQ